MTSADAWKIVSKVLGEKSAHHPETFQNSAKDDLELLLRLYKQGWLTEKELEKGLRLWLLKP